jgi:putrescine transport system substrate-binding protein
MRILLAVLATLLLAAPVRVAPARAAEERVLNVYNWTDYIDPKAIARFEAETGIKVRYDVYDSLETLEAKLSAGASGYDIVVPTSEPTFSRLVRAGALAALDRAKLPHAAGLDPALMHEVATSDPGGTHGVIYLWGTIGLGENPDRIRALDPDAPLDSWDLLFKPEHAKRIAACGISMLDSATDVIPTVLRYLGRHPDSTDAADLAAVERTLRAVRPYIRTFASSGEVNALADGSICLAFSYSGDVIQASARAVEAKRGTVVRYAAPREFAQLWFDMLAVPADAPHKDAALAFIDFLLRPDVMAGITNTVHYPNAVPASLAAVDPAIKSDPNVYPTQADMARFFTVRAVPQAAERARTRMWARFKAG